MVPAALSALCGDNPCRLSNCRNKTTAERGAVVADIMSLLEQQVITPYAGERFSLDKVSLFWYLGRSS